VEDLMEMERMRNWLQRRLVRRVCVLCVRVCCVWAVWAFGSVGRGQGWPCAARAARRGEGGGASGVTETGFAA
jgi:hypothetical protein